MLVSFYINLAIQQANFKYACLLLVRVVDKLRLETMSVDPLARGRVIGDVLDPFTKSISLRVLYNNRLVVNGTEIRPSAIVSKPRVDVGGDDFRVFYTLVSSCSSHLDFFKYIYIHTHTCTHRYIYIYIVRGMYV